MHRPFLAAGFLLGFLAVAAGAFGAHGLAAVLDPPALETWETGARYQMYHALALVAVGLAAARWPTTWWSGPALLFIAGTVVFSGSLYFLALTGAGWLAAIAPLGGASLLAAWVWCLLVVLRKT